MKKFDLNIEKILENWEIYHAIREVIANALDEQLLTKTKDVEIFKSGNCWIIRDFGRGLKYTHLTQNENQEKLDNKNVIGKFGIGLKDAVATFDRRKINISILSKYNAITIIKSSKQGFQDIITLHAVIEEPNEIDFIGTEIRLENVTDRDIENAKKLFLKFSEEEVIESTKYGQVIRKNGKNGNIYINGVKVSEEERFLFSYNITTLTASIKKALNRERSNVGRTAYTDSVKKILLSSEKKEVAEILAVDLQNMNLGTSHDELAWIDVQEHSVKILNEQGKYLFVTSSEAMEYPDMLDQAKNSGHDIITIPESLKYKIQDTTDLSGNPIVDINQFVEDYNDSFEFNFIDPNTLTDAEKNIYRFTPQILKLSSHPLKGIKAIKISSTMRANFFDNTTTLGCWDAQSNSIVISRHTLKSLRDYAGTLIHELIHASTGYSDVTRLFESALTEEIGAICEKGLLKNITKKPTCP